MSKNNKKIMVVKSICLNSKIADGGLFTDPDIISEFLGDSINRFEFHRRGNMEKDPSYKQIIPYVIIQCGSRYLTYTRTKKGGEARLHSKKSIGVGGHIEQSDAEEGDNAVSILSSGLARELSEELNVNKFMDDNNNFTVSPYGILYDDSNDVGRVHIGYVAIIRVKPWLKDDIKLNEPELASIEWLTAKELLSEETLENWSKIVVKKLAATK